MKRLTIIIGLVLISVLAGCSSNPAPFLSTFPPGAPTPTTPVVATSSAPVASGTLTWSAPVTIEGAVGVLRSVSCVSSSFCVAVDDQGYAFKYNGTSWSTMGQIAPKPANYAAVPGLVGVSCPSNNFCMAVSFDGSFLRYDGTSWSSPVRLPGISPTPSSVSCISASFCVTAGFGAWVYNGTSWSSNMILPEVANKLWNTAAVSCASINFCLATGGNDVAIYNGKTWSSQSIVTDGELADVSCVNPSYCMAADEEQVIQFYNGTSWSAQTSGPTDPEAVSCPSIDFCEAGNSVFMSEYNGTSWSKPTSVDFAGNFDLSCASRSFCVVVDDGEAIVGTR